jgi:ADP-heptose:LPS heptosyltransferase
LPLADVPGVRLIRVQTHHGLDQVAPLAGRLRLIDPGAELDGDTVTFRDLAGLMSLMDLIVTIDSAPAHLAGALGVPTWVALSAAAEWHWIVGREDSPWYPTVRVFRQAKLNDWEGVFRRMARELSERVAGR